MRSRKYFFLTESERYLYMLALPRKLVKKFGLQNGWKSYGLLKPNEKCVNGKICFRQIMVLLKSVAEFENCSASKLQLESDPNYFEYQIMKMYKSLRLSEDILM